MNSDPYYNDLNTPSSTSGAPSDGLDEVRTHETRFLPLDLWGPIRVGSTDHLYCVEGKTAEGEAEK